MAGIADLFGSAKELLAAFTTELQALGVVLPTDDSGALVSYVSPGSPAAFSWDAECLAIIFEQVLGGTPGQESSNAQNVWTVNFSCKWTVLILRAVAGLNDDTIIPTPEQMEADALTLLGDTSGLILATLAIKASPPGSAFQEPFAIGTCEPVGPMGGMVATAIDFTTVLT